MAELEANAKRLTSNLRVQSDRHMSELTTLKEQIQEMKTEHQQRMDSKENVSSNNMMYPHRSEGPRVVRGGVHISSNSQPPDLATPQPKAVRGGNKNKSENSSPESNTAVSPDVSTSTPVVASPSRMSSVTGGLFSRLLGSGTK